MADVPIARLNVAAPEFAADPYPALEELRAQGPITWHEGMKTYLVTRWKEASELLLNNKNWGSAEQGFIEFFGGRTMECMERPRHGEVRGVWAKDFEPRGVACIRGQIERVIRQRLDPFVERVRSGETVDAVEHMTRGIPTIIIAEMLGIDPSDYPQFAEWSDSMGDIVEGQNDPTERGRAVVAKGRAATAALNDYIRARIKERGDHSGGDLISKMMASPVSQRMDEAEIVASNTQLVFAGNETTAKLMATTLYALAEYPDQRRAIVQDRALIPQAIEEVHRWITVTHIMGRFARNGAKMAGVPIPDGARVTAMLGIANRDTGRWERPDEFDIFRPIQTHLGFGFGMHICLGMHLARLEAQAWLNLLLDVLPEWEVADLDWGRNWAVRGPLRIELCA